MPRKTTELPYKVEFLTILDKVSNLDKDLELDISEDLLLELHRALIRPRSQDGLVHGNQEAADAFLWHPTLITLLE